MRSSRLLSLLIGLTYFSVALGGVWGMPSPLKMTVCIVILALIGLAFALTPLRHKEDTWKNQIRMGLLCLLVSSLLIVSPGWTPFPILFFVLAAYATVVFPIRKALLWVACFTVITLVINVWTSGLDGLVSSLSYITGYFFFGVFGYLMSQADVARLKSEELLKELQKAHEQLKIYANQVEELTIERERNHLAREVHDTLGHQLTVSVVQLEGAQRLAASDPVRTAQIIGTVRDQVKMGLADLRRIVATLHAPGEEDSPLLSSIQKTAKTFQEATGIQVKLDIPSDLPPLSNPVKLTFYRTLQEGLTNVQKHAQASRVIVSLLVLDGQLTLTVEDNGVGLGSAGKTGFGLLGLKERATLTGGTFGITSPETGGVKLSLSVPISGGWKP